MQSVAHVYTRLPVTAGFLGLSVLFKPFSSDEEHAHNQWDGRHAAGPVSIHGYRPLTLFGSICTNLWTHFLGLLYAFVHLHIVNTFRFNWTLPWYVFLTS
ncbi:hypothetical protein NDU88_009237 [Pleurodeles waltl]|uniref:Uncharacterized protein n=1 Tax=Pleurodeles waltl TaxID=8319 RepID=A0AAV7RX23_PLEWA|nr:hypothetical protein NDU88_009237 [Pleurodeles waltl]